MLEQLRHSWELAGQVEHLSLPDGNDAGPIVARVVDAAYQQRVFMIDGKQVGIGLHNGSRDRFG
jgi:hypothetical protein